MKPPRNYNNISNQDLGSIIKDLSSVLQAMNNRLESLSPQTFLHSSERAAARERYVKEQSDMILGEMMLAGLFGNVPGVGELMHNDSMFDSILGAAEDLHESQAWQEMSQQERALIRMRQHMYKKEVAEQKRVAKEQSRIEKTMTAMAMAMAALEKRMKRQEARERKEKNILAFVQNRHSMKNSKVCKYKMSLMEQKEMLEANYEEAVA